MKIGLRRLLRHVCMLVMAGFAVPACAMTLVYPRPEAAQDARNDFPVALLGLALSKSCPACRLVPSSEVMMQSRALAELENNAHRIDVAWSMTSFRREKQLRPVRISIYKDLLGWRVPLVMPETERRLAGVRRLGDLTPFLFGQVEGWPDTQVLRSNGLNVVGSATYDTLFNMLAARRFDLFPRALNEIVPEWQAHAATGMMIDRYIVLHYPASVFYFVNPGDAALARLIDQGLRQAIKDGSYQRLFNRFFLADIRALHLADRHVIELKNPVAPPYLGPRFVPDALPRAGGTQGAVSQTSPGR